MSTRFSRPASLYDSTSVTTNMTKYRTDSAAFPKVTISSVKVDGDINKLIDAVNALDDDIVGLVAGSVPDGSITTNKLANLAVTTAKIADAAVTTGKMALLSVDNTTLADNSVLTSKILDANVTETKIANAAISTNKIAADAVTTVKILDANVTTSKLAANSVNGTKIAMGSDALGDLMRYDGTDYVRLPVGSTFQYLKGGTTPVWTQPPFTEEFISSNQTVPAAGGLLTVAHGMGGKPKFVQLWAICTTAANGYSVGDVLIPSDPWANSSTSNNPQVYVDDNTNINVRIGASNSLTIFAKNTGVLATVTTTNYAYIVRAWR